MKKLISLLLLAFLLVPCLVSCSNSKNEKASQDESDGSINVGDPYELVFKSNGDGTCKLIQIKYNTKYQKKFAVEIPEKSPDGDTVVDVAFESLYFPVPRILLKEDHEKIAEQIETVSGNKRNAQVYGAFFVVKDLSDERYSEKAKEYWIANYPMVKYSAIAVCELTVSTQELLRLADILYSAGFDSGDLVECYKNLYKACDNGSEGTDRLYEEAKAFLEYNLDKVTEITFPKTIEMISHNTLCAMAFYKNLEKVNGLAPDCTVYGYYEDYMLKDVQQYDTFKVLTEFVKKMGIETTK